MRLAAHETPPDPRARLSAWLANPRVQRFVLALIIVNAALMGLETSAGVMAQAGRWILALDRVILGLFVFNRLDR